MNVDVNGLLLMVDIVLYGSSQDVQGFPPLLTRAMSFGIPIVAPDYPVVKKYVSSFNIFVMVIFVCKVQRIFAFCSLTFTSTKIFRWLMEYMG